jgi:hypothetical protein
MQIKKTNSYLRLEELNGGPLNERYVRQATPEDGIDLCDGDGDPIYLRHPETARPSGLPDRAPRPPEIIPKNRATGVLVRLPSAPLRPFNATRIEHLQEVWHQVAPAYLMPTGLRRAMHPDYSAYRISDMGVVDKNYTHRLPRGGFMMGYYEKEERFLPNTGLYGAPSSKMLFYRIQDSLTDYQRLGLSDEEFQARDRCVANSFGIVAEERCYSIISPLDRAERMPFAIQYLAPSRVLVQGTQLGEEFRSFFQISDDKLLFLLGWQGYLLHNNGERGVAVEELGWLGPSDGRGWVSDETPPGAGQSEEAVRYFMFCDKEGVDGRLPRVQFIFRAINFHNNPQNGGFYILNSLHSCLYPHGA